MYIHDIEFHSPTNVEELLELLDKYGDDAKVLAGGTDLILQMKFNKWKQNHIINLKGVKPLNKLEQNEDYLTIGCNTTLSKLLEDDYVKEQYKALWQSIYELADRQIRNRGTLIGNICNASPAADTSPALLCGATLVSIQSRAGKRVVPLEKFFVGPGKTVLEKGEFVDEVHIPKPKPNTFSSFQKLGRTYDDIAIINVAVQGQFDNSLNCHSVSISMGAVGPTTKKAPQAEIILKGNKVDEVLIKKAAQKASEEATPITDVRATAEYRKKMIEVLTERALFDIIDQIEGFKNKEVI